MKIKPTKKTVQGTYIANETKAALLKQAREKGTSITGVASEILDCWAENLAIEKAKQLLKKKESTNG